MKSVSQYIRDYVQIIAGDAARLEQLANTIEQTYNTDNHCQGDKQQNIRKYYVNRLAIDFIDSVVR